MEAHRAQRGITSRKQQQNPQTEPCRLLWKSHATLIAANAAVLCSGLKAKCPKEMCRWELPFTLLREEERGVHAQRLPPSESHFWSRSGLSADGSASIALKFKSWLLNSPSPTCAQQTTKKGQRRSSTELQFITGSKVGLLTHRGLQPRVPALQRAAAQLRWIIQMGKYYFLRTIHSNICHPTGRQNKLVLAGKLTLLEQ